MRATVPQAAQRAGNAVPQAPQKRIPSGTSVAQFGQRTP
jgi:hypothetical protein